MDDLRLLIDLHIDADHLGPGGDAETRLALDLAGLASRRGLAIADIGCGTGASTLVLARELDADITAIDVVPPFLDALTRRAAQAGSRARITTRAEAMERLSFADESLDVIWSEGAIYNIGFERGVREWRRLLKPGGVLAVTELTWLTAERPAELDAHWTAQYPEVDTAAAKLAVLERQGFSPLGYFPLPRHCWMEHYYDPLRRRFAAFLNAHASSDAARSLVAAEEREIQLYERYHEFVGYGFYIARRACSS